MSDIKPFTSNKFTHHRASEYECSHSQLLQRCQAGENSVGQSRNSVVVEIPNSSVTGHFAPKDEGCTVEINEGSIIVKSHEFVHGKNQYFVVLVSRFPNWATSTMREAVGGGGRICNMP